VESGSSSITGTLELRTGSALSSNVSKAISCITRRACTTTTIRTCRCGTSFLEPSQTRAIGTNGAVWEIGTSIDSPRCCLGLMSGAASQARWWNCTLACAFLLALLVMRVDGHFLVTFYGVTFLPRTDAWYSGLLPYPILLPSESQSLRCSR
jgi:hypothetical protein